MSILDERTSQNFLIYANSVIKSRAIPSVEDNLKPIHRKILWTLYEDKVYDDAKTKKCATEVGRVLAYSPHGDASVYGALVRLAQWWKLRYPLVYIQGNAGNLLGDSAAASRYTECRLSPLGMLMLEDINKNCVDFKPNYDNTTEEPVTLPSKFPFLLCGNNSGIAVGMGSDIVSHNFTEVSQAIEYYMMHKDCTTADLMKYIQGPDFPTGGVILNGEDLPAIYERGTGSVKVAAHYDITKKGKETMIIFHDLPYGVEIDDGIKKPLKKLVLEDGYDVFKDIVVEKAGPRNYDISITLSKDAKVDECLKILFSKTKLQSTIKINNNFIVNGEPRVLSLKGMIAAWVDYRSNCIKRIAQNDYAKTNHKLTVVIGLQKCMSDIDKLVSLIRESTNRAAAKSTIMKEFELNDEQAEAVLDMKLSRLSKLDLVDLDKDEQNLRDTIALLKSTIEDENLRYQQICADLKEIKKIVGPDNRLTEINYTRPIETANKPLIKEEYKIYTDGLHPISVAGIETIDTNLVDVVYAYSVADIYGYTADGTIAPIGFPQPYIGACVNGTDKTKLVAVTKNGNIKVSLLSDYKLRKEEKILKLKEDDELLYAGFCNDNDNIVLFDGNNKLLKLAIKDLPVASKATVGVKSGFAPCNAATLVNDSDLLLLVTKDMKGKYTPVKDFSVDSRGNKGQTLADDTICIRRIEPARENIYLIPKQGKPFLLARNKLSIKSRTATGAALSTRNIIRII